MVLLGVSVAAALAVAVLAISVGGGWPSIGAWFVDLTPLKVALGGLIAAAVLSGLSYQTLRRAVP